MSNNNAVDVSFILPSIRINNWQNLYESIQKSFTLGSWEVVFVGPYNNPKQLEFAHNVKCISDWGSPTRCRHIGLLNSTGKWMCYASDDLTLFPGSVDQAFARTQKVDYKTIILCKYFEGAINNPEMLTDQYYKFGYHGAFNYVTQWIPKDYWLIQSGLVTTQLLKEIGGWDWRFEGCAMACSDLAVRLQNYGTKIIVHDSPLGSHTHVPGISGDHAPIHYAQTLHDEPLFNHIYSDLSNLNRTKIDIENWKNSPEKWSRRFS